MKTLNLSYELENSTPAYGGEKKAFQKISTRSIKNGDNSNNSFLKFNNHIGTHIDFPYHFSENGKKSSDYNSDFWVANNVGFLECKLSEIDKKIQYLNKNIEFLILKTGFYKYRNEERYWKDQPVIKANLADIFKEKFPNLRFFGFDMISLTSKRDRQEGKIAHINFLINNKILIIEDMNLENLISTPSSVIISPLLVKDIDGAPCNILAFL